MPRYKLTIEYDGVPFAGWQRQSNGPSIQAAIEDALASLTQGAATVYGAGRTDAGVHALGQVAHVDLDRVWQPDALRNAINAHLRPKPVSIISAEQVGDDFHARFSAVRRRYLYRIVTRNAPLALDRDRAWRLPAELDAAAMSDAARVLVGHHDFTTFRSADCQARSSFKTLDRLDIERAGDLVSVHAEARSFLHHQVRSMVGSLKLVGEGKWTSSDLADALAAADRSRCGPVAPAHGLYLVSVDYEPTIHASPKLSTS
jgi:tRNA pseudouridine38-40 synthase